MSKPLFVTLSLTNKGAFTNLLVAYGCCRQKRIVNEKESYSLYMLAIFDGVYFWVSNLSLIHI